MLITAAFLIQSKGLLCPGKVCQPFICDRRANTRRNILLESVIGVRLQSRLDRRIALRRVEPGAAGKVELVGLNQGQDVVQIIGAQPVGGGKLRDLAFDAIDALGVEQVEVGHLHIGSTLTRAARRDVVLEFEVDGLKGHKGDDGGHLGHVVDFVIGHALGDEGSRLLSSAAFGSVGTVFGSRSNLLDDGGSGKLGRREGGEAQDERGGS